MPSFLPDPSQIISQHHWWHTIDVGPNLVTPGAWDIRHLPAQIPWPDSLAGKRCLDVGTMDGFWAFEMERRGAGEVLAIDVRDSEKDTLFYRRQNRSESRAQRQPGETFNVLVERLASKAKFR